MAKAEISVQFAAAGPVRLREEVAGRVRVRALEPLKCQGIDLAVGYKTTGDCDGHQRLVRELKGEAIELLAGSEFEKEFNVRLPEQPMSFKGEHFNIVWFVRVEVRLPRRFDLVEEREFMVAPARPQPASVSVTRAAQSPAVENALTAGPLAVPEWKLPRRLKVFFVGLVMAAAGTGLWLYVVPRLPAGQQPQGWQTAAMILAMAMLFVGLAITFFGGMYLVARDIVGRLLGRLLRGWR